MPHRNGSKDHTRHREDRKFRNLYSHLRERHFLSSHDLKDATTMEGLQALHEEEHLVVQDHTHKAKETHSET